MHVIQVYDYHMLSAWCSDLSAVYNIKACSVFAIRSVQSYLKRIVHATHYVLQAAVLASAAAPQLCLLQLLLHD